MSVSKERKVPFKDSKLILISMTVFPRLEEKNIVLTDVYISNENVLKLYRTCFVCLFVCLFVLVSILSHLCPLGIFSLSSRNVEQK